MKMKTTAATQQSHLDVERGQVLLEARHINKSFNGIQVLNDVHFDVRKGEVHSLMGENGAGKSTLIKIITGAYTRDSGELYYAGQEIDIQNRQDAARYGIAVIFQELSSIPTCTVAQNILLGREPTIGPFIDRKKLESQVTDLINEYGFPLKATDMVESLSIAQRQMVEILKALSTNANIIIMDEPTASLSAGESEILFSIIRRLRDKDVSIIYISHRLEEVYMLSDRLTVLRDGKNVTTLEKGEIDPKEVINLMIGKTLEENESSGVLREPTGEVGLEVRHLTAPGKLRDVSFQLHRGEILGISGLVGSGRTELLRAIYGADRFASGEILLEGKPYRPSLKKSVQNGIGLIPEDRRNQGFVPLLSINKNVALTSYDHLSSGGVVSGKQEKTLAQKAVDHIDIRPKRIDIPVGNLSGGNQQKVVLGKWLMRDLKLLLIDEPTAGIDVGAKDEIYSHINALADSGVMVLLVTSDLPELIKLSHRILVMRKGAIIKEFTTGSVTEEDVLQASSGII
ncbi:MAG: sugar ABC transporter ATP-binding protein [Eubacteriales bacterium]|jgi:ribose transport system ATP-binding protein